MFKSIMIIMSLVAINLCPNNRAWGQAEKEFLEESLNQVSIELSKELSNKEKASLYFCRAIINKSLGNIASANEDLCESNKLDFENANFRTSILTSNK